MRFAQHFNQHALSFVHLYPSFEACIASIHLHLNGHNLVFKADLLSNEYLWIEELPLSKTSSNIRLKKQDIVSANQDPMLRYHLLSSVLNQLMSGQHHSKIDL